MILFLGFLAGIAFLLWLKYIFFGLLNWDKLFHPHLVNCEDPGSPYLHSRVFA